MTHQAQAGKFQTQWLVGGYYACNSWHGADNTIKHIGLAAGNTGDVPGFKIDKRQAERVLALLEEIRRTPFEGTGKPEPGFQLAGCWSRRIDQEHRLVYQVEETEIVVIAYRY